jgi:nucleoside phosphorylase
MDNRHICIFTTSNAREKNALEEVFDVDLANGEASVLWKDGVLLMFKQIGQGNLVAAADVMSFLDSCESGGKKPQLAILVGIAGGIEKTSIGDVVTCETVLAYEFEKLTARGRQSRYPAWTIPVHIKDIVAFEQNALAKRTSELANKAKFAVHPNMWIISGEKVVDPHKAGRSSLPMHPDLNVLKKLHNALPRICAIEMEGAGFAGACERKEPRVPWLIVRGISDNAKQPKTDALQDRAALHAASYVKAFVEKYRSTPIPKGYYPSFCGKYNAEDATCRVLRAAQDDLLSTAKALDKIRESVTFFRDINDRGVTKIGTPEDFNDDYKEFFNSIKSTWEEMGLMGTGLRRIFQSHLSRNPPQGYEDARNSLLTALNRGMKLKVLINNPFEIDGKVKRKSITLDLKKMRNMGIKLKSPSYKVQSVRAYLLKRLKEDIVVHSINTLVALHEIWSELDADGKDNLQVKLSNLPFDVNINYRKCDVHNGSNGEDSHPLVILAQHYMSFGLSEKSNTIRLAGHRRMDLVQSYIDEFDRYWNEQQCPHRGHMFKVEFSEKQATLERLANP